MKAINEFYNFGTKTTKELGTFSFQLEGNPEEIDHIWFGNCPCIKGSYDEKSNTIFGTIDPAKIITAGSKFVTKYIEVALNPEEPEFITKGELPKDHVLFIKGSKVRVPNPNKNYIKLQLAGDVKFVK